MSLNRWLGDQPAIAQVVTLVVGSTTAGHTFITTMNGKSISYAAGASETVSTIASAIQALLDASDIPEFKRVSWTVDTDTITGTALTPGVPFTVSKSGTGTYTLTTATANNSPNDIANTANWSLAALPTTGDDVLIEDTDSSLLWNLDALNGVALASLTIRASFEGTIGLPEITEDGYREYFTRYLQLGVVTAVDIGAGDGSGSGRILLELDGDTTVNIISTGTRAESAVPSVVLTDLVTPSTGVGSVVNVQSGDVGIAIEQGQTATVTSLRLAASDATKRVTVGEGCTLTAVDQDGGTVDAYGTTTALAMTGGTFTQYDGTITTITARGGVVYLRNGGTVTTATFTGQPNQDPPRLDLSFDPRPVTITNHTFTGGAVLFDPGKSATFTNAGTWDDASQKAATFGKSFSLQRT